MPSSNQKKVRILKEPAIHKDCPSTTEINDLCSILTTGPWKAKCLGFLAHKDWHFHMHDVRVLVKPRQLVSLRAMLKLRTLTLRER